MTPAPTPPEHVERWSFETFCKWLLVMLAIRVFGADLLTLGQTAAAILGVG